MRVARRSKRRNNCEEILKKSVYLKRRDHKEQCSKAMKDGFKKERVYVFPFHDGDGGMQIEVTCLK